MRDRALCAAMCDRALCVVMPAHCDVLAGGDLRLECAFYHT